MSGKSCVHDPNCLGNLVFVDSDTILLRDDDSKSPTWQILKSQRTFRCSQCGKLTVFVGSSSNSLQ